MKISVVQKKISKYIEKCPSSGELLARPQYSRNHAIRIGASVKSLLYWVYVAYNQRKPDGYVYSFSDNPQSVDPSFSVCAGDLRGELEFEVGHEQAH
jgi:hypothetical protein